MYDAVAVQILDRQNRFSEVEARHVWWQWPVSFDQRRTVSSLDVFHHQAQMFLDKKEQVTRPFDWRSQQSKSY